MSTTKSSKSGRTFIISDPMGDDGVMAVRDPVTGENYEIVDYGDELLRERAKTLSPGSTGELELAPVPEGDAYAMTRLLPGGPVTPFGAD